MVGENVAIAKTCTIVGIDKIVIGGNSRIDGYCNLIATGPLLIGRHVHIHSYCQIGSRGGVTLDDFVALASGCFVYSASDEPSGKYMVGGAVPDWCIKPKVAPVHFEKHSGAFSNTTILPGVTFGEGAIACAHSLVSRDIPAWTIVSGVPARHRLKRSRNLLAFEEQLEPR